MAATASSAPNSSSHSPRYSMNSPISRSRRPPPSPWTQIVRGGDSDLIQDDPAPSVSAEVADGDTSVPAVGPSVSPPTEKESLDNDNAGKKPAWNKPSNSSAAEVGPVMGAESWPALSVSARVPSNRSSSSESLKGLSDGSSSSTPALPVAGTPSSTQKQSSGNANANPDPNASTSSSGHHNVSGQKKPYKRSNTASASSSNVANPSPPQNAAAVPSNTLTLRDQSHNQRSGSHGGGNPQFRNSHRNRNSGSYPRGDGVHHQNYGSRRNYDHGNQTVFPHRNYNGRDMHMQPQRGLGLMRPQVLMGPQPFPANSTQFMAAPHLPPFGRPMLYPEYASTIYMPPAPPDSMALIGQFPPQPMYYPGYDPMLFAKIVKQVDFYFSADNLSKDKYLRQHMDDEGWVPISLIAGFRKLAELTNNIQIILDAVRNSTVVEVQGESIRRRGDWNKYVWPRELRDPTLSSTQSVGAPPNHETLAARVQNVMLSDSGNLRADTESSDAGGATVARESTKDRSACPIPETGSN